MKKWLLLLSFPCIILLVGGISATMILNTDIDTSTDMAALNAIVQQVQQNWDELEKGEDPSFLAAYPFAVLDDKGKLVCMQQAAIGQGAACLSKSASGYPVTINGAIKERYPVLDLVVDDRIVGKLVMYSPIQENVKAGMQTMVWSIWLMFGLAVIICLLYLLLLWRLFVRPFHRLQHFAQSVARGQLDLPLKMEKNNWFGAFTESFDLMRDQLATARTKEYEANRSKKELVATLSHDIKTPIASIQAVSELLLLQTIDENQKKKIQSISAKAKQVDQLINEMFHATMEELQELNIDRKEVYSSVLDQWMAAASYDDDDKLRYSPVPPCLLLTDPIRLQQVFDNLISNSLKYAGTPIEIHASLTATHLIWQIDDFGPGVPEEELHLLLNKFYRGSNAEGKSGVGLGLYVSSYLMDQMQGELYVANRQDGFSAVVSIPLVNQA